MKAVVARYGFAQRSLRGVCRVFAATYAVVVSIARLWDWYIDVELLDGIREHRLPDTLLALVTLPTSLSLEPIYKTWPEQFSRPLAQLAWFTLCGVGQVALVLFTCRVLGKNGARATVPLAYGAPMSSRRSEHDA
jgi:hypothetical protein